MWLVIWAVRFSTITQLKNHWLECQHTVSLYVLCSYCFMWKIKQVHTLQPMCRGQGSVHTPGTEPRLSGLMQNALTHWPVLPFPTELVFQRRDPLITVIKTHHEKCLQLWKEFTLDGFCCCCWPLNFHPPSSTLGQQHPPSKGSGKKVTNGSEWEFLKCSLQLQTLWVFLLVSLSSPYCPNLSIPH